jgi:flagellar motor switch protein FliM
MRSTLSKDDIDRLLVRHGGAAGQTTEGRGATPYDFRRPDRIPKEQVRAVYLLHDFLARHLAASLGAYLRTYVKVALVSVEQVTFGEFLSSLPTPTCIAQVGVKPMEGNAVLEISPSLVLPMLDIVLGGDGKHAADHSKELTDIERSVMETIFRIVLNDLRHVWAATRDLSFHVQETETQPQLMQILAPNEAVVAIGFEIALDDARGMLNFSVPSVMVKSIGQRLDQQWSVKRQAAGAGLQRPMESLLGDVPVTVEARVSGGDLTVRDVLELAPGDVLSLGTPVTHPADVLVSGVNKFSGRVVAAGLHRAVQVLENDAKPNGAVPQ